MRREERVTVQGPVKKQQPDGMSHNGGHCTVVEGYAVLHHPLRVEDPSAFCCRWPEDPRMYTQYCPVASRLFTFDQFREFTMGALGMQPEAYQDLGLPPQDPAVIFHSKVHLLTELVDEIRLYMRSGHGVIMPRLLPHPSPYLVRVQWGLTTGHIRGGQQWPTRSKLG